MRSCFDALWSWCGEFPRRRVISSWPFFLSTQDSHTANCKNTDNHLINRHLFRRKRVAAVAYRSQMSIAKLIALPELALPVLEEVQLCKRDKVLFLNS